MNNNIDDIKIYNSVWNNNYIKKIIFYYLKLFTIYKKNITFYHYDEFIQFKHKEYLYNISLKFQYDLVLLPDNIKKVNFIIECIKSIKFSSRNYLENNDNDEIIVPEWVNNVGIFLLKSSSLNSDYFDPISNKLKSLIISCRGPPLPEIKPFTLPSSLKELALEGAYPFHLGENVLPKYLKKLKAFQIRSTTPESFPQSLKYITLIGANHLILYNLPESLIKLKFIGNLLYDINNIKFGHNLQKIKMHCNKFISAKFPNTLKKLFIRMNDFEGDFQFPKSLQKLSIYYNNNLTNNQVLHNQNTPVNLKYLKMSCESIFDIDGCPILPNSLESLKLHNFNPINNDISFSVLSNLTFLDFGQLFNHVIDINVLPINLNTLILGKSYTHEINPLAIPQNLKLLQIINPNYNHQIKLIKSTNTVISCKNVHLYYNVEQYIGKENQLHVIRLPKDFNEPLSSLQLHDKYNLEYIHLGNYNREILQSDLPSQNNIKTLELINNNQTINLEYFNNLETIIINSDFKLIFPKIKTKIDENNNYQFYNLKRIIIYSKFNDYLKSLDINFIHLIKHFRKINKYNLEY